MKRNLGLGLLVTFVGLAAALNVHLNRQKNISNVSCGMAVMVVAHN